MTTPDERRRALKQVADFLVRLANPYVERGIKRIPLQVRREARYYLKHLPSVADWDIHGGAKKRGKGEG